MLVAYSKKKTDYKTKISEIEKKVTDRNHDEYITNSEFHKFKVKVFDARLKQSDLVTNADLNNQLKSLNKKN